MELQKKILGQYFILNEEPTFKAIAEDTGIQVTRVFRLYNGSTMKLSEFQIFQKKVKELMGLTHALEELARECSINLSPVMVKELEVFLSRKMQVWNLNQANNKQVENELVG